MSSGAEWLKVNWGICHYTQPPSQRVGFLACGSESIDWIVHESFQNLLTPTEANKTRFTHSAGLKQSKTGLTHAEAVCLIGEYVFTAPLSEGCLLGGDLGWIVQAF